MFEKIFSLTKFTIVDSFSLIFDPTSAFICDLKEKSLKMGCWSFIEFSQKNKPQGNALVGGIMVLLVGGMQIGWIFDNKVAKLPWSEGHDPISVAIAFAVFYISAIGGLFAASVTVNRLTKSNIYVSDIKAGSRVSIGEFLVKMRCYFSGKNLRQILEFLCGT